MTEAETYSLLIALGALIMSGVALGLSYRANQRAKMVDERAWTRDRMAEKRDLVFSLRRSAFDIVNCCQKWAMLDWSSDVSETTSIGEELDELARMAINLKTVRDAVDECSIDDLEGTDKATREALAVRDAVVSKIERIETRITRYFERNPTP